MNTIQLKNALIQRINEIEDVSFLKAIKTILDARYEGKILKLTPELKTEIINSKKEIAKGLYIDNEQLEKDMEIWLNEE